MLKTEFASSPDGIRIAYDLTGDGTALVLLHGGGHNRQSFHKAGYVERFKHDFTVITIDIRGNGESDKPNDPVLYTTEKHCQDVLAVVDACGVSRFVLLGFSYGGNIGRYLAVISDRVTAFIMIGIPFGATAQSEFRQFIKELLNFWPPVLQAQTAGTLDLATLSEEDQTYLFEGNVPLKLSWLGAMLDWQPIEPNDLLCPTLWLIGSENESAMASFRKYKSFLPQTKVEVEIVEGLNHQQEFSEIDIVLPRMVSFLEGGD